MGQVSLVEVEQDRHNEALHLGIMPVSQFARGLRVHTGLETTQDPNPGETRPVRERRNSHRVPAKFNIQNWAANETWLPHFFGTFVDPTTSGVQAAEKTPAPHYVVVVVERMAFKPLFGPQEIWLSICKRNDVRRSWRPPTHSDRHILESKYPGFFFAWHDAPSTVDCLGEWTQGEWNLKSVFDPYA